MIITFTDLFSSQAENTSLMVVDSGKDGDVRIQF
jgi:hypothetical protein